MTAQTPFFGYIGQVWSQAYAGVAYFYNELNQSPTPSQAESLGGAALETIINALGAINASRFVTAWTAEISNLQAVQALPLMLSALDLATLNNRTSAYIAAASGLSELIPMTFPTAATAIAAGTAAVPDLGLIGWYQGFEYETPPTGLTAANFVTTGQGVATSFNDIAAAIAVYQGANLTQAYDTATRQAEVAAATVGIVADFTSGGISTAIPVSQIWNQILTLPTFATDAAVFDSAPYLLATQQACVIRYVLLTMAAQIAVFLLVLRQPVINNVQLATLPNNATLMDLAASALGNFEEWTQIATANSLLPPYVGAVSSPGIAGYGQQLLMPGSSASPTGTPPSYANNFLGIDFYIGPINGPMPPWSGDFQTIAGYSNLAISLGRRLQTTLGTLLYHSDFGSRIPPEVGAVQTTPTAGQIAAFGRSAILSDPRVAAVLSATATVGQNFSIIFQGVVQPAGFGTNPVSVNEVILPSP